MVPYTYTLIEQILHKYIILCICSYCMYNKRFCDSDKCINILSQDASYSLCLFWSVSIENTTLLENYNLQYNSSHDLEGCQCISS